MFKQIDSFNVETSLNSFKDIFSEYFSDNSEWEIRTLKDFYVSVNNKGRGNINSLFINVKESENKSYKIIDFKMVFKESYNLHGKKRQILNIKRV